MNEKDIQNQKEDYLLRNFYLGIQPSVDEMLVFEDYPSRKIDNTELEKFRNSDLFSRIFNHLLAGATLGFYNPYKISVDQAEKENWMYKRFIRIPFLEDIISPYGFSFVGLVESLPLLAYGGLFKALGAVGGTLGKVLSSGIKLSEKVGVSLLENTAKFMASKIPEIERTWMSLSPQVRKLGYEIIKKDIQFSPWVAGSTYREKLLSGEEASRAEEYLSALYNPVNLLFAGAISGIEARLASRGLMASGKTFWEALGELQKLDDLRLPSIRKNIETMIKDGLVEKNPLSIKSLFSYFKDLGGYLDSESLINILGKLNLSDETTKLITKDGLLNFINSKLNQIPLDDVVVSNILENPAKFLREDLLSGLSNKEILNTISKYSDDLVKISQEYVNFFDEFLFKNKDIMDLLTKNNEIFEIISKPTISDLEKVSVVNFFLKQKDVVSMLKSIPEIKEFLEKNSLRFLGLTKTVDDLAKEIKNLSLDELLNIRNKILNNKYIIPVSESVSQITDNVVIPKEFIKDVLENLQPSVFITPQKIANLIKTRQLFNFLKENMIPENFSRLLSNYQSLVLDDISKIESIKELAKIDEKIKKSSIPISQKIENKELDVVNSVIEKQYFKSVFGIEKNDAVELAKEVNLLLNNAYDLLERNPVINSLSRDEIKLLKDYFSPEIIEKETISFGESGGLGPVQKFFVNLDLFRSEVVNNVNLAILKASSLAVDYLLRETKEFGMLYKIDLVNYFLGKKSFTDIEKTARKIWNELKSFRLVSGAFSKKNFFEQMYSLYDKDLSGVLSKEAIENIYSYKKFVNKEFADYIKRVYKNANPEEISKILENEAILRKNLIVDELTEEMSKIKE